MGGWEGDGDEGNVGFQCPQKCFSEKNPGRF